MRRIHLFLQLFFLFLPLSILAQQHTVRTPDIKPMNNTVQGTVLIDGSSTVYPITKAITELYTKLYPGVRVSLELSGTGGGFKKFIHKETHINNSSRQPTAQELSELNAKAISPLEIPIAIDGISVVVHARNDFAKDITVDELRQIWLHNSVLTYWSDVRPNWPRQAIRLYGPDDESGTFDYFREAILHRNDRIRMDYKEYMDDEAMLSAMASDPYSLGFVGFAYMVQHRGEVKALAIDNGKGPVEASFVNIKNGQYLPLSRRLFLHVNETSLRDEAVFSYLSFYVRMSANFVKKVGYIPLATDEYAKSYQLLVARREKVLSTL